MLKVLPELAQIAIHFKIRVQHHQPTKPHRKLFLLVVSIFLISLLHLNVVEGQDVEEVKGVFERWHKGDSVLVLQKVWTQSRSGYLYLELCANRHVVAEMLFHPVNLLSVGLHDRRQGDKVCPDSAF